MSWPKLLTQHRGLSFSTIADSKSRTWILGTTSLRDGQRLSLRLIEAVVIKALFTRERGRSCPRRMYEQVVSKGRSCLVQGQEIVQTARRSGHRRQHLNLITITYQCCRRSDGTVGHDTAQARRKHFTKHRLLLRSVVSHSELLACFG